MEILKVSKDIQIIFDEIKKKMGDKTRLEDLDPEFVPYNFDVWT